jgi:DNA-binding MarR family transcriptional regulator
MRQVIAETGIFNGDDVGVRASREAVGERASPWEVEARSDIGKLHREARLATAILTARRRREEMFGVDLFADPAWDMLLDLFVKEANGASVHVASLCAAAAVPTTTALRWIGTLSDAGLVERHPTSSSRRVEIRLSRRGFRLVLEHLRATAKDIVAIVTDEDELSAGED